MCIAFCLVPHDLFYTSQASRTVPDVATEAPVVNPYVSASDPAPPIISTGLMPSPPRGPKTSAAPLSTSPRQLLEPVNDDDTPHAVAQVPDRRLPARAMDDPVGLSGLEEVPENCLALAYSLNERLQLLDYGTAFCEGYMKGAVTPMPGILFLLQPTGVNRSSFAPHCILFAMTTPRRWCQGRLQPVSALCVAVPLVVGGNWS